MTQDQLKTFIAKVKGDSSLRERIKTATDAHAVNAIAKEKGLSISAELITDAQPRISEEDLEVLAGGNVPEHLPKYHCVNNSENFIY